MRTRNHDWFDSAKMAPVYGVQIYHDGKWRDVAIDGKIVLCATEAERAEQRKRIKHIAKAALAMVMLVGCATDAGTWPKLLSDAEVRRDVKACKGTGMVPELVKEQGRTVWVQCWPTKNEPAP